LSQKLVDVAPLPASESSTLLATSAGSGRTAGEDPVIVDRDSWRVEDLLDVHVHRAGNASELLSDLLATR